MSSEKGISQCENPETEEIKPQENDIQTQLAFINHLSSQAQKAGSSAHQTRHRSTQSSPKILDSLANSCVSRPGEVIATAMRPGNSEVPAEIIIATDGVIPEKTIGHLRAFWAMLRNISLYARQGHETKVKHLHLTGLITSAKIKVLEFTFREIQRKVISELDTFRGLQTGHLLPRHPIWDARRHLWSINCEFMRAANGYEIQDPPRRLERWSRLYILLEEAALAIRGIFKCNKTGEGHVDLSPNVEYYLKKIVHVTKDLKNLTIIAIKPRYKSLFDLEPVITALPHQQRKMQDLPCSSGEWLKALKGPLTWCNQQPGTANPPVFDGYMEKYCEQMTRYRSVGAAVVHCEVKLLMYLCEPRRALNEDERIGTIAYIGVSRVPCLGCFVFHRALNEVLDMRFEMNRGYSGPDFPWAFPERCPRRDEVLQSVYSKLTTFWVPWYSGCSKHQALTRSRAMREDLSSTARRKLARLGP
ncbi:hypothetical protein FQN49_001260 [Arthroderma sp. PD_2]|nr:hypothetical protein FQN49_001260 [Arthroderma sp. PD_2]